MLSSLSKNLSTLRSARVSASPVRNRPASPTDLDDLLDDAETGSFVSTTHNGAFYRQSSRPDNLGISGTGPNEPNPPAYSYPNVPSLYELMPDNPRVYFVPSSLQEVPIHLLRFPFNYIANGIRPHISNLVSIENFNYFGIYETPDNFVIAENFEELTTLLQEFATDVVRWFPFCHEDQASWYVNGGCLEMESFDLSDFNFYLENRINKFELSISSSTSASAVTSPKPAPPPPPTSTPAPVPYNPFPGTYNFPQSNNSQGYNQFPQTFVSSPPGIPFTQTPYNYSPGISTNAPWIYQTSPPDYQSVLFKTHEIDCPKWDGNTTTWHNMHTKLEVALASANKSYLLTETCTTPQNAVDSKLFFKAMFNKFSGNALVPFTGQLHLFLNKGIEMYRELLAIYAPVDQETLLALSSKLQTLSMHRNESVLNYVKRIRLLSISLTQNGQSWPETHLTLTAIKGLDSRRYSKLIEAFHIGNRCASTLREFIQIVTKYDSRKNLLQSHSSLPQPSPSGNANAVSSSSSSSVPAPAATPVCDPLTDVGWTDSMTKELLRKYKCCLCRTQDHMWPSCPHLKHWDIKKKSTNKSPY